MSASRPASEDAGRRFTDAMLYRGARLYYTEDRTQAEIADLLHISRPSVSRCWRRRGRAGWSGSR